jgi:hypothetical protein
MRYATKVFTLLVLLSAPALAQSPPTSANPPPTTSRMEELLLRIVRAIEGLQTGQAQPTFVRWEYRCVDVSALQSDENTAAKLNMFGGEGWELAGTLGPAPLGAMRVCFKRPGVAQLSASGEELGCSPICSGGETCYKAVCIAACSPACADDQYCTNDHHCRTRTKPRR